MSALDPQHGFRPTDRVTWVKVPVACWHLGQTVDAVVRKLGKKRVQIAVKFRPAYSKSALFEEELKWVSPDDIEPRLFPSEAHGEALSLNFQGFELTPWKHPNNHALGFQQGTFYGAIDGYTCTAPVTSAERAIPAAHHALLNGGYRAALLTAIDTQMDWLDRGVVAADKIGSVQQDIRNLRLRLVKLFQAFPAQLQPDDPSVEELLAQVNG